MFEYVPDATPLDPDEDLLGVDQIQNSSLLHHPSGETIFLHFASQIKETMDPYYNS
jgi:hypothetical protein